MSDPRDDADLRERFGRLRREEAEAAPGFRHSLGRARAGAAESSRPRWPIGAAALATLGVAGLMLWLARPLWLTRPVGTPGTSGELRLGETVGSWRTPTDVLLETPGSELLRTLPDLRSPELRLERPRSETLRRSHT